MKIFVLLVSISALSLSACSTAGRSPKETVQSRLPASTNPCAQSPALLPMDCFAKTRDLGGVIPHLWDLASADPDNFPAIFNNSEAPSTEEFYGTRMNGVILYVKHWELGKAFFIQYTGSNWDLYSRKLYSRMLTFQKRFYSSPNERGESGVNFWPVRGAEAMPMKIYVSEMLGSKAGSRQMNSLKIDYGVPSNGVTERPLLDEVRKIPGSNLYIGKMYVRIAGLNKLFLWFALEKNDSYR